MHSDGLYWFCYFTRCIKPVMFVFQRAEAVRPASNSSVERHSADQEDTGTVTQVTWHILGVQQRATKLMKAWSILLCVERLTHPGWFSLEKTEGGSYQCL